MKSPFFLSNAADTTRGSFRGRGRGGGAHGVAAHAPPAAHRAPQAEVCAVLGKLPVANGPGVVCSP